MNLFERMTVNFYRSLLICYPLNFRAEFGDEMMSVFSTEIEETKKSGTLKLLLLMWREFRDWPGAVWREHLQSMKGFDMNKHSLAWEPVTTKELKAGLTIFVVPLLSSLITLIFGYRVIINQIGSILGITVVIITLTILILGFKNGFPRWTIPYLGVSIVTLVMLGLAWRLWELFYFKVENLVKYHTKTLAARIEYSALLHGFFWFLAFAVLVLMVLLLAAWSRTRPLAQQIRQDWTLFSFMVYSAMVFNLELVFEEYAYDEAWKIACRVCLTIGAWIYFKSADQRKRILALLSSVTLTFWIATVGKWIVLPLQSWSARYGFDHWTYRRFELGNTLAQWGWVVFFMLIPALLALIPKAKRADLIPEQTPNLA